MKKSKAIKVLDKGKVALLDVMGNDKSIAEAARISYSSNKKKKSSDDRTLIRHLMRHKHTSCLEMVEFKFYLKLPIFVHNQLVRHRMASQNVMSGRYSMMLDEFYVPKEDVVTFQNPSNKQGGSNQKLTPFNIKNPDDFWDCLTPEQVSKNWSWGSYFKDEQELTRKNYERYVKSGMRTELARINLPLSQYTELYWKIDLHNLLHFLSLRLDDHAQYEIRVFAEAIYKLVKKIVPITCEAFEDYTINAMHLTKLDLVAIGKLLKKAKPSERSISRIVNKIFTNNREKAEFANKFNKILK